MAGKKTRFSWKLMIIWVYFIGLGTFSVGNAILLVPREHQGAVRFADKMDEYLVFLNSLSPGDDLRGDFERRVDDVRQAIADFKSRHVDRPHGWSVLVGVIDFLAGILYIAVGVRICQRSGQSRIFLRAGFLTCVIAFFLKIRMMALSRAAYLPLTLKVLELRMLLIPEAQRQRYQGFSEFLLNSRAVLPFVLLRLFMTVFFFILLPLWLHRRSSVDISAGSGPRPPVTKM